MFLLVAGVAKPGQRRRLQEPSSILIGRNIGGTYTGNTELLGRARNCDGIWLDYSSNNSIVGNTITANNNDGIELYCSDSNIIIKNKISDNHSGIKLGFSTEHNNVSENILTDNDDTGIYLFESSNNSLVKNDIERNSYGIYLKYSSGNKIYHNSFVNNNQQIYAYSSPNVWDDGYPSGGNYWNDYGARYPNASEIDSSGIWNTPYVIDENNQDNYPLISEFPSFLILPLFIITTLLTVIVYRREQRTTLHT